MPFSHKYGLWDNLICKIASSSTHGNTGCSELR